MGKQSQYLAKQRSAWDRDLGDLRAEVVLQGPEGAGPDSATRLDGTLEVS